MEAERQVIRREAAAVIRVGYEMGTGPRVVAVEADKSGPVQIIF